MSDNMREVFEAHITKEYGFSCNRWEDGEREYIVPKVQNIWLGWQAAQAVPVVGEVWRWAINKVDGTPLLLVNSQADADKYRSRSDLEVFPVYRDRGGEK